MESDSNINMDASTVFKNLLTIVGIVPENITKKTLICQPIVILLLGFVI